MKANIIRVVLFVLLGVSSGVVGPTSRTNVSHAQSSSGNSRSRDAGTNTVSYQGVSFTFDHSLASEVRPETIPASTEGKPSDIWPEHPGFKFVGYRRPRAMPPTDPHMRVFSVNKFREAFASASKEYAKSLVNPSPSNPPDWTLDFDKEVRILKTLLVEKPRQAMIGRFLAKARGEQGCRAAMPFLPMWEACQAFVARVRYVNFRNGEGVLFLTQWDTETSRVTNQGLEYAFQGITNDGQHYVYAEFSVSAPFLPRGDEPEINAWNVKNYLLPHKSAQYQKYVRPIVAKLEVLPANQFQPNLRLLEQLIESLEVKDK